MRNESEASEEKNDRRKEQEKRLKRHVSMKEGRPDGTLSVREKAKAEVQE